MFVVFTILWILALLSFGGVQPSSYLGLAILCSVTLAADLGFHALAKHRISIADIACWIVSVAAMVLDVKLALVLLAVSWGWIGVHRYPKQLLVFLKLLVVVGVFEASLGLIQYFLAPGWIFGYLNLAYVSSGTLINRSHFAGLLEMILPTTLALAYAAVSRASDPARTYLSLLAGALMFLAIVFSTSRMGLFASLVGVFFVIGMLRMKSSSRATTVFVVAVLGVVLSGVLWIGIDIVLTRFAQLGGQEDALLQEGRFVVYGDTIKMISDSPLGVGIGGYQDGFRRYQTFRPDLLFDHAHNDYLETTAEWGVLPALIFWGLILGVVIRAIRSFLRTQSLDRSVVLLAALGAIVSLLVHSLTDFNLQIPSNAMLFFVFVGIAAAASRSIPFRLSQD